jgi:ribose-phosphate pyrophosphokinase
MDAFKRASAGRITAVIPYYGYARQDRKAKARDPITAKLVADLITTAGADRVLTMDLHAAQIQGYFNIPVDHLLGVPILAKYYQQSFNFNEDEVVVVSPDLGSVTRARKFADRLHAPIAIKDKRRPKANVCEVMNIIGDIKGKTAILIDDLIDTAGTIKNGANALMDLGAKEVYACCTHAVLSGPAIERIEDSPIKELVMLNTVPLTTEKKCDKIKVLSVAPVFAEAIKRIYEDILGLKAQVINKDKIKTSLEAALKDKSEHEAKRKELETNISKLNFSEENYKKLEEQVLNAEKAYNATKLETAKAEGELKQIKAIYDRILDSEKGYKEKLKVIKSRQDELNHLIELDRFYGQFLEKLNNLARPEISELASRFLAELTDGRYQTLELNEKYEICLYDDGEIKPVISGGEEDIANLCIRLAISQMIAQRSGKGLSLLILDEVFGSLDENRRSNVVSLLNSLTNSFDQVILITHIDDIKEGIDNIIKVEYDEEKGCSQVTTSETISENIDIELSLF